MRWLSIFALATLCVCNSFAQIPESLEPYFRASAGGVAFFEVEFQGADGAHIPGWIAFRASGAWVDTPQGKVTRVTVTHLPQSESMHLPPSIVDVTLRASDDGIEMLRSHTVRPGAAPEDQFFPDGTWFLPADLREGKTWTTGANSTRSWGRVDSMHAHSPNPNFPSEDALTIVKVAADRDASGAISVEVEQSWFVPGEGMVQVEQWRGPLADLEWGNLTPANLAALVDRRDDLDSRTTMRRAPRAATQR